MYYKDKFYATAELHKWAKTSNAFEISVSRYFFMMLQTFHNLDLLQDAGNFYRENRFVVADFCLDLADYADGII
jgi:hypothetical protein